MLPNVSQSLSPTVLTVILLGCSNVFMTFAWYGHLRNLSHRGWLLGAVFFMFRSRLGGA
ncbi:MAG: DMT family protein [Krumholzibacteria bacterium]|nr:DMT family protein [Candidatus Krumholzibacteria bacterium]